MQTEHIKAAYKRRVLALLTAIGAALTAAGHEVSEPFEMTDDEYRWDVVVDAGKGEASADIAFTIVESTVREGSEDGVAFALDITGNGGAVLGGLSPFNYTDALWIAPEDADGIERRFRMMERVDVDGIVEAVEGFQARAA